MLTSHKSIKRRACLKLALPFLMLLFSSAPGIAGTEEDASAAVDKWSATFSANDRNGIVELYASDALLFGTNAKVPAKGREEIYQYFAALDQGNRRNTIIDRTVFVLNENSVVVAGYYNFDRAGEENQLRPARFTMLLVKRQGQWLIQHHHSSPQGQ